MKPTYNAFALLLIVLASSCQKDSAVICKVSDKLTGRYNCTEVAWFGNPIDINNDGVSSSLILDEFSSMSNCMLCLGDQAMVATGVKTADDMGYIMLRYPMQGIRKQHGTSNLTLQNPEGDSAWYRINYSIDRKGNIHWQRASSICDAETYVTDDGKYLLRIDFQKTGPAFVEYASSDTIMVYVEATYYDWASKSWVTGELELSYRKVS